MRSLGTRETNTSGFLSMVMFQPDYAQRLIEIGEADGEAWLEEIREMVEAPETAEEAEGAP